MGRVPKFPGPSANPKHAKATFNRKLKFDITTKYCISFCKSGHCIKGTKCLFVHDADKVAICKKFLYGKCKSDKCLLSHNPTPDKMPDCSFFLKGYCKVDNCKYRHVKVSADAILCTDFLNGYCSKGLQCENLHSFLCKVFNKTGQCPRGTKCSLAHQKINANKFNLNSDLSKYKKVNTATSEPKQLSATEKPNLQTKTAILNSLLARRLRNTAQSDQQIVSQPKDCDQNFSDFVPLSSDATFEGSLPTIEQIISHKELDGKVCKPTSGQSLKRKYFVIDSEEEKMSDYLNSSSFYSSESICRPHLKIIPDFLAS